MRPVSPEFNSNIAQNLTQLCRLWSITRKDGEVFRFTDHDKDIPFNGDIYQSNNSFEATAVQSAINSAGSDLDVTVLLNPDTISYQDVMRGLFDEAPVTLQIIQYTDTAAGVLDLFKGNVSTTQLPNTQIGIMSLVGGVSRVNRVLTERYSPQCRAIFGDDRCKVNLAPYTVAFAVSASGTTQTFTAAALASEAANLYTLGTVTWLTGRNKGTSSRVAGNAAGLVQLLFRPPYQMEPGDTGTITRGCPRTIAACKGYNNIANYRGEPYVPGDDGLGV